LKSTVSLVALFAAILFPPTINLSHASTYTVTVLGSTSDAIFDAPSALNDSGQVVGHSLVAVATVHAILWDAGKVIDLGTFGGNYSYAHAINDAGTIVGFSETSSGVARATRWSGSTSVDLDPLSEAGGSAADINNLGQIIINRSAGSGTSQPVLLSNNTFVELPLFPGSRVYGNAKAINDSGKIAGSITDLDSLRTRAVLWDRNTVTDLGTLYENFNSANDINNADVIVGVSMIAEGIWHATRWSETGITDLGALTPIIEGSSYSEANAINEAGQIVGYSILDGNPYATVQHATLWENGVIVDLNDALDPASTQFGWEIVNAYDINSKGVIVAEAWHAGFQNAVLLTPVPEPEAFMMLLAGLGLLGFKLRIATKLLE
jgi:probable HAF family extracellular repeat protein